jgi:hypothetical protein
MASENDNGTTSLELALAWAFVGIPLLWEFTERSSMR